MLFAESFIGLLVHPFGSGRKWACQVRRCTQANADLACASQAPQTHFLPLATVSRARNSNDTRWHRPSGTRSPRGGYSLSWGIGTISSRHHSCRVCAEVESHVPIPAGRRLGWLAYRKAQTASVATSLDTVKPVLHGGNLCLSPHSHRLRPGRRRHSCRAR